MAEHTGKDNIEANTDRFMVSMEKSHSRTEALFEQIFANLEILLQRHNLSLSSLRGDANSSKEIMRQPSQMQEEIEVSDSLDVDSKESYTEQITDGLTATQLQDDRDALEMKNANLSASDLLHGVKEAWNEDRTESNKCLPCTEHKTSRIGVLEGGILDPPQSQKVHSDELPDDTIAYSDELPDDTIPDVTATDRVDDFNTDAVSDSVIESIYVLPSDNEEPDLQSQQPTVKKTILEISEFIVEPIPYDGSDSVADSKSTRQESLPQITFSVFNGHVFDEMPLGNRLQQTDIPHQFRNLMIRLGVLNTPDKLPPPEPPDCVFVSSSLPMLLLTAPPPVNLYTTKEKGVRHDLTQLQSPDIVDADEYLLNLYCKIGDVKTARQVIEEMPKMIGCVYNSHLMKYIVVGKLEVGITTFPHDSLLIPPGILFLFCSIEISENYEVATTTYLTKSLYGLLNYINMYVQIWASGIGIWGDEMHTSIKNATVNSTRIVAQYEGVIWRGIHLRSDLKSPNCVLRAVYLESMQPLPPKLIYCAMVIPLPPPKPPDRRGSTPIAAVAPKLPIEFSFISCIWDIEEYCIIKGIDKVMMYEYKYEEALVQGLHLLSGYVCSIGIIILAMNSVLVSITNALILFGRLSCNDDVVWSSLIDGLARFDSLMFVVMGCVFIRDDQLTTTLMDLIANCVSFGKENDLFGGLQMREWETHFALLYLVESLVVEPCFTLWIKGTFVSGNEMVEKGGNQKAVNCSPFMSSSSDMSHISWFHSFCKIIGDKIQPQIFACDICTSSCGSKDIVHYHFSDSTL